MAKKSILKSAPKKRKIVRTPRLMDEKYTGVEPNWTNASEWSEEKIKEEWQRGYYYYNYHYVVGDMIKYARQYCTQKLNWSKEDIQAFNEVEEWRTGITAASACKMLLNGAPLMKETEEFLHRRLNDMLALGKQRLASKTHDDSAKVVKLTIQDRMKEKLSDTIGEIEGWYDNAILLKEPIDMIAWMRQQEIPQVFVNQIAAHFTPAMEELELAMQLRKKKKRTESEDQLVEGYSFLDKDQYKIRADFYSALATALETYGAVKKAVRKARVKKPVSKEKLVKKVKYCVENKEFNLVSVNPVDILGSNTVWIYNIKTRKLGRYVAADDSVVLGIKGSTIIGFDNKKSIAKTLRKPQEQLKAFSSSGKVALRTFIEDIKAVPVELNGRLNSDIIILKVVK
jgi:hypothetical protein